MASVYLSVGIIIISWSVGFLSYSLISNVLEKEKKTNLEELGSQLINFIFFIWIGKVILNFPIFIKAPSVILAYPSNSASFYFAIILTTISLFIKEKRGEINVLRLLDTFIFVFLISSIVYEFIQIVYNNNRYSVGYFILLAALTIALLFIRDRVSTHQSNVIISVSWILGAMGLSFTMPLMMVFGYTMQPWFFVLFFLICFTLYLVNQRKKVM